MPDVDYARRLVMRGIDEVAFDAAREDAGVEYCFVGAFAVMAWGEPRATTDADALVILHAGSLDRLVSALGAHAFQVDPADMVDGMQDGSPVTIFADDPPFYVKRSLYERASPPRDRRAVTEPSSR